jgi:MFS transporter, FLVCR family, MFS-domain-containing protein 7
MMLVKMTMSADQSVQEEGGGRGGGSPMMGRYHHDSLASSAAATGSPPTTKKFEPFELEQEGSNGGEMMDETSERLQSALLSGEAPLEEGGQVVRVYFQRWIQLGYLSGLTMLSDWVCFSVAASRETFEEIYKLDDSTKLIDWFFLATIISCFMVTDCVSKFGLQRSIQASAIVMAVGTWFRCLSFYQTMMMKDQQQNDTDKDYYPLFVMGTLLVGAAQPFCQCTAPQLSALWFASNERATSTAVALNFDQIGIATAFLVGGPMGATGQGLAWYFLIMALFGTVLAVGCILQFQAKPPTPPSPSEIEKEDNKIQFGNHDDGEEERSFLASAKVFLHTPGFLRALSAFICSIAVTNIVGALIEEVMNRGGVTNTWQVAGAGAIFEVAILVGGIVLGGYVDRTKQYKSVIMWCLGISIFLLLPLGLTDHKLGQEPSLMIFSLLLLGFFTGPIQPICAELAVDITFPGDETAVESVQQIGGNLISALLMPIVEWAAKQDYELLDKVPLLASDIRGDVVLLVLITLGNLLYFARFHAPLKRTMADSHALTNSDHNLDVYR